MKTFFIIVKVIAAMATITGFATVLVAGVFSLQTLAMDGSVLAVVSALIVAVMDDEWKKHLGRSMTAEVSQDYFYRRRRVQRNPSARRPRR